MFNKEVRNTGKQVLGGVSATNTVVTVGILHLLYCRQILYALNHPLR